VARCVGSERSRRGNFSPTPPRTGMPFVALAALLKRANTAWTLNATVLSCSVYSGEPRRQPLLPDIVETFRPCCLSLLPRRAYAHTGALLSGGDTCRLNVKAALCAAFYFLATL